MLNTFFWIVAFLVFNPSELHSILGVTEFDGVYFWVLPRNLAGLFH